MKNNPVNLNIIRGRVKGIIRDKGNRFQARCPAHNDKNPSLTVTERNGQILLYCHAGCMLEAICDALRIHPSQLFSHIDILGNGADDSEKVHEYQDEFGNGLFEVVRSSGKKFTCRRPDHNGGWKHNLNGVERVLYRLPQLKNAREQSHDALITVFICEGEKDVETLEGHGLLATCNPHGAGKWRDEYSCSFSGLDCVILPDNDEAGRNHAETVAKSIQSHASSVRILSLPGLREKGDVTDWFEEPTHSVEEFLQLALTAPIWKPHAAGDVIGPKVGGLHVVTLDELFQEPDENTSYVVEGLLPTGGFSVLSGKPKVGKTTTIHTLAYSISRGDPFLGRITHKGRVIYFCLEEKRQEVRNRFKKMGASGSDILICSEVNSLATIDQDIRFTIAKYGPVIIVIDPMVRVVRANDFNDYAQMTRALEPFIDLARMSKVHILMSHHDGKSGRTGGDGLLGSTAIFGTVDTHLQMAIKDGRRTIMSTNRYGEDLAETVITFNKDLGIVEASSTVLKMAQANLSDKVLDCFDTGESLSEKEIKARVGSSPEVSRTIRDLLSKERFIRSGKGKKGDPFHYRLAGSEGALDDGSLLMMLND